MFIPSTYFKSEWSCAQYKIPEIKSICAFNSETNNLISNYFILPPVINEKEQLFNLEIITENGTATCKIVEEQTII